ncbi:MAG TPA: exopolysaccharide Pel transporter PelG [Kofleriaceae bacterium]|nr:exopolysaccharide Pel transporter PelG [Kofleriaceae bacterium]
MAGIGWRLEKLIDRDSLGSTLGALLTGVAVTSGPWLLTTIVLVLMRISAMGSGHGGAADGERVITIVYAIVIVLAAPVDIILSRFAADRVYEGKREQIAAPMRRLVAACLVAFTAIGAAAMFACGVRRELAIPGTILSGVVGTQWLLLSAAGGLSSPGIILRAFGFGAPISVAAAAVLSRDDLLGPLGHLYGYGAGQLVTLTLLLWGTMRALPEEEDESARILPAFVSYWLLAAAALAFHAGLWVDKLVVYLQAGASTASTYAATAAVAWLSVVPACAFLFVAIETSFHRRFDAYYKALEQGASLARLDKLATDVRAEVYRTLRGTAAVQACVTLVCVAAIPWITRELSLSPGHTMLWLLVGAGLQVVAMATTLLLYYFDFRREALAAALAQLCGNALFTALVGAPSPHVGAGYAVACALACVVALSLLRRSMAGLLERTFQSQPYSSEDFDDDHAALASRP